MPSIVVTNDPRGSETQWFDRDTNGMLTGHIYIYISCGIVREQNGKLIWIDRVWLRMTGEMVETLK